MANVRRRVSRFSVDCRESCFVQLRREALHRNVFSEKMGIAKNMEKRKILIEDAKEYFGNIIFLGITIYLFVDIILY